MKNLFNGGLILCRQTIKSAFFWVPIPLRDFTLYVWGIGFLSDLIGAALLFPIFLLIGESPLVDGFLNPVLFPGATITAIPGVILAGFMIYFLNKKLTFRKSTLDAAVIHKLCLHLALWTAPYTMLIPLYF